MSGTDDHEGALDDPEDRDGLAAEYVLGTLDAVERADVAARLDVDPDLSAAVERWESLLAPLTLSAPERVPPTHVWQGLEHRLEALQALRAAAARRAASRSAPARPASGGGWRALALAASLAAVVLGGLYGRTLLAPKPTESGQFVAVLQPDGKAPGFLVRVDVATRQLVVQRVGAPAEADKAHELWIVTAKAPNPVSLGVVGDAAPAHAELARFAQADVADATYAISLEPAGGSPTGLPTGPVVFSGKLVPMPSGR